MNEPLNPLLGQSILVTRPLEHAPALMAALSTLGAQVHYIPLLEVQPIVQPIMNAPLQFPNNTAPSAIVFVSPTAVRFGLPYIQALAPDFTSFKPSVFAIGPATQRQLSEAGVESIAAEPATSEGLLNCIDFQAHKQILIIRGQGGRELLAHSLRHGGATVNYLEVYQRRMPLAAPESIRTLMTSTHLNWVVLTSLEIATNWCQCAATDWFKPRLLVSSTRIQNALPLSGRHQVVAAAGAGTQDLINALLEPLHHRSPILD